MLDSGSARIRRVGFSDQAHFSRSFKRHFGMTPSEYREARQSAT